MSVGSDGAISAWGLNDAGQVGDGTISNHVIPGLVLGLTTSSQIAAGDSFAMSLKGDGTVVTWGDNSYGQLGNGTTLSRSVPATVPNLTGIISVSTGSRHALALKSDGSVWAWGSNGSGQLGDGTVTQRNSPVRVNTPSGITAIVAGDYHSLALRNDGTLWAWGSNGSGRLGIGNTTQKNSPVQVSLLTNVTSMAGGAAFSLASKGDGSVWAWGSNSNGQLGDGTVTSHTLPAQITALSGVSKVVAGDAQSFALTTNGLLYAWGSNSSGRLGDGTTTQRLSPVLTSPGFNSLSLSSGVGHTLALSTSGQLFGWGENGNGQLGDGTTTSHASVSAVIGGSSIATTASGAYFSLALRMDGRVLSWGNNDAGQLGDGTIGMKLSPISVTAPTEAVAVDTLRTVAAGNFHTVVLGSNGMTWAWGLNSSGQLGDGTKIDRTLPSQVVGLRNVRAVAAGEYHTIALTSDGKVMAWGQNKLGQVGNGLTDDVSSYAVVTVAGGSPLANVIAIAAGSYHNLALTADGKVYAWGSNSNGQLGVGGNSAIQSRAVEIQGLPAITAIAAGAFHSLVRTGDGRLFGWGANFYGALGTAVATETNLPTAIMPDVTNVIHIGAGAYHSMAVKADGSAWAWGWNGYGQLGDGTVTTRATAAPIQGLSGARALSASLLIAGNCAGATSAGTLETWGANSFGQLGSGGFANRAIPSFVNGLPQIASFATGGYHTVAATVDGPIYVWGYNGYGQLGTGNTTTEDVPQAKGSFTLAPQPWDTDGDNLPDSWELQKFGNLSQAGDGDPDGDGLINLLEFQQAGNPLVADQVPPSPAATSSQLVNGSGRAPVGVGENTIIAGFIVRGDGPKKVMIRALGPSLGLAQPPVANRLADPKVELFDSNGTSLAQNDNWRMSQLGGLINGDQVAEIQATGLAPHYDQEAVVIVTLAQGNYTAHIKAANNATGIALLEIYDLQQGSSQIVNVSARARLSTGDNVLIGGFTIAGNTSLKIITRALGPSLAAYGITGALQDPTLQLYSTGGTSLAFNDNWRDTQQAEVIATGIPPADNRESAIITTLAPGAYTAIVRGKNQTSGVALVEVYALQTATNPGPQGVTAAFTWTFSGQKMTVNAGASTSTFGSISQYQWNWGDGSPNLIVANPPNAIATHTYSSSLSGQTVTVTLTATDDTGRTGEVRQQLVIGVDPPPSTCFGDSDCNGLPDAWEIAEFGAIGVDANADPDVDGLNNLGEYRRGTRPLVFDTDNDGLSDGYEASYASLDPLVYTRPDQDADNDGMGVLFEGLYGLNPELNDGGGDMDGDGLSNLGEYIFGSTPQQADADGDQLTDLQEKNHGTDPWLWDTDGDGLSDGWEVLYGHDPKVPQPSNTDSDNDGLTDFEESMNGTDPTRPDSDGDGVNDGPEVHGGADPTDPSDNGQAPSPQETVQVAFQIQSSGKTVTANCAVCHNLQVQVGPKLVDAGAVTDLRKGQSYEIKLKDKPETWKPTGQEPPHESTAKYTLWPQPVGENQTITAAEDKKTITALRDQVLEYLINNQSDLLAQDKQWEPNVLSKAATITSVAFITPAGDPVQFPVDGGDGSGNVPDGANEFTFSSAANGVLTLKLKAKMPGASTFSNIQNRFKFEVDAIGSSTMAWNAANPGGKPTISGDFLTATITFTGLPQSNLDFGKKKARMLFDGSKLAEKEFEVFFPKTATNHPGGQSGSPNWYHYWAITMANKAGSTGVAYESNFSGRCHYELVENKIYLGDGAATTGVQAWGVPKGIDCYGWSTAHEAKHRSQMLGFWPSGRNPFNDQDQPAPDFIPDNIEPTYMPGRPYNPTKQSTYPDDIGYGEGPFIRDNEDIDMRSQTGDYSLDVLWENGAADAYDWANPGKNSKEKF